MAVEAEVSRQSFIFTRRLFIRKAPLYEWWGIVLDLFMLVALFGAWLCFRDLAAFGDGAPSVEADSWTFGLLLFPFAYGARLAHYVGWFRGFKRPQPVEWCLTLGGAGVALLGFLLSAPLLSAWGAAHGYQRCALGDADGDPVFVKSGAAAGCPTGAFSIKWAPVDRRENATDQQPGAPGLTQSGRIAL